MPMQARMLKVMAGRTLMIAALAALVFQAAHGQSNYSKASTGAKTATATAGTADDANKSNPSEVANTLKAAAEAVGLARWSGVGGQRLPEVDVINTMEIWAAVLLMNLTHRINPANWDDRLKPNTMPPSVTIRPPCAWK